MNNPNNIRNRKVQSNKSPNRKTTIGFGVPTTTNPHHFQVIVPCKSSNEVVIEEHLGMNFSADQTSIIHRSKLKLEKWKKVRKDVQLVFNRRLKEHKLKRSTWSVGINLVDRMLGKELCVLAWSIEDLNTDNVPYALNSWIGLRPEERWWLFGMAARTTAFDDNRGYGWKAALKYAFATRESLNSSFQKPSDSTQVSVQDTLNLA